jgi:hypothetical protein
MERRLALSLVRHAAFILPNGAAQWGAAMQCEVAHISPDRAALRWALGCVTVGYLERIASLNVVHTTVLRWALAAFIATWTTTAFLAAFLLYTKLIGESASMPSLADLPTWSLVLDGIAGVFYAAGVYCLIHKRLASVWLLLAGTGMNGIACIAQVAAFLDSYDSVPPEGYLHGTYLNYALHGCVILLLWLGFRGREPYAGTA